MGSIVHRSVPTNLKWFPNCSHAHALFQDRFKDVQVGSKVVQYTVHPLTKLSHPVAQLLTPFLNCLGHRLLIRLCIFRRQVDLTLSCRRQWFFGVFCFFVVFAVCFLSYSMDYVSIQFSCLQD